MSKFIEIQHPDVDGTAWVMRSALSQMHPDWSPVPKTRTTNEPPGSAPTDPEPTQESETD